MNLIIKKQWIKCKFSRKNWKLLNLNNKLTMKQLKRMER